MADTADSWKQKANEEFKKKNYTDAIALYTKSIECDSSVAAVYANRSFANLKIECFGYALNDANKAIELDPKYVKAYYRRASANMLLSKFKEALKDFAAVVKACPNDKDAKEKFKECDKIVKRIAFEKAISVQSTKSEFDDIDLDNIVIESSYDGPKYDLSKGPDDQFIEHLMKHLKAQQKLHKKFVYDMLFKIRDYLKTQPSLVHVDIPENSHFTVCGDVHGQFFDLAKIFELNGMPSEDNPYLFNGDFVDRGSFSVECVLTLFALKLRFPQHMWLARGNHESVDMNKMYGFEGEVKSKYSPNMVDMFTEVFCQLPLAHCIAKKIFVVHGGLPSTDNVTLEEISKINRNCQPCDSGLMCDMLWADPQDQLGRSPSKRGVSMHFGPDITKKFCEDNGLSRIIRSHEVKSQGYEYQHDGQCITVFSAPNYCDQMGNKGAYIKINHSLDFTIESFSEAPHPPVRPMQYANSLMSSLGLV